MSHQYSLKTFLRQVRGSMLNQCLRRQGIEAIDLGEEIIKNSVVDEKFRRFMSLPEEQRKILEADFTAIHELASGKGTEAILAVARDYKPELVKLQEFAKNGYEWACWVYLKHPDIFEQASCYHSMDRVGAGRWQQRMVGRGLTVASDPVSIQQLQTLMQQGYAREGRGRFCHIDYYRRTDPVRHCFFAYPEDHARLDLRYNRAGTLRRDARKSAQEVIFVYRPEEGTLEVKAAGGQEKVDDLAACFCIAILGLAELPPKVVPAIFDLSGLLAPDLSFPTDPADGIELVQVREVRIALPRYEVYRRCITLDKSVRSLWFGGIRKAVETALQPDEISIDEVIVSQAIFDIVFTPRTGQRAKRLSFELARPNRCTLKDTHHDHIARKYIHRWGFVVDQAPARISA